MGRVAVAQRPGAIWLHGYLRFRRRYASQHLFDRLIDKENQSTTKCSDQPITKSYCLYVRRSGERFSLEEASLDKRVALHPKRQKCSVLLRHSTV